MILTTAEAFEAEAREFLLANLEPRSATVTPWGDGSDAIDIIPERTLEEEQAVVAAARAWRRKVYEAGFGWPSGPRQYGGRELPVEYDVLYHRLEQQFDVPDQSALLAGMSIIGPAILKFAQPEARDRYLAGIYRGDVVCCQLFSEPGAGSDLGGMSTRADRQGDAWIVNGQKVWTSGAQVSDLAQLFVRTSVDKPRHRGISVFLVDMKSPGVMVRPIRQMTGGAHFNEVFLDDVRVPDTMRMGDIDGGWAVILETLRTERSAIGLGTAAHDDDPLGRLLQLARHHAAVDDPVMRDRLAAVAIEGRAMSMTGRRLGRLQEQGAIEGSEAAMTKLMHSAYNRRIADLAAEILGPAITADNGEWGTFAWSRYLLAAPALRIAGGTDEILRNTLAEQVLGMPRDPRPPA